MKIVILSMAMMAFGTGCGDDGAQVPVHDASPVVDSSIDAPPLAAPCFSGTPTTHEQIINACTNAQEIFKDKRPPLLNPDGSLPSLPP